MRQNRFFQRIILFMGLSLLVIPGACSSKSKKKGPGPGDKVYPVSVMKVLKEEVPDIIELKGTFIPSDKLEVKSETEGKVTSSPVNEGQMVNLGEPLASINPEVLNLLLDKLKLELREQEAKIEAGLANKNIQARAPFAKALGARANPEGETPPNPDQNPDLPAPSPDQVGDDLPNPSPESVPDSNDNNESIARANEVGLDRIKAEIVLTEKKIESANIGAGIAGVLTKKNVTEGSAVTVGEVLFQIVKIDPILLSVMVNKKEVTNLHKGDNVEVKTEELAETSMMGEISYIAAEADPQNKNNYEVRISVSNTQLKMRAGMPGTAVLPQAGVRKALLIPDSALVTLNNKKYVYVVEEPLAVRKEVELGNKVGTGKIEVTGGIKEGETVIVKGQTTFKNEEEFIKVE